MKGSGLQSFWAAPGRALWVLGSWSTNRAAKKEVVKAKTEALGQASHAGDYTQITLREMGECYEEQGHQLMPVA